MSKAARAAGLKQQRHQRRCGEDVLEAGNAASRTTRRLAPAGKQLGTIDLPRQRLAIMVAGIYFARS